MVALAISRTKFQSAGTKTGLVNGLRNAVPNFKRPGFYIARHLNFESWTVEFCIENEQGIVGTRSIETEGLFCMNYSYGHFAGNSILVFTLKSSKKKKSRFVPIDSLYYALFILHTFNSQNSGENEPATCRSAPRLAQLLYTLSGTLQYRHIHEHQDCEIIIMRFPTK